MLSNIITVSVKGIESEIVNVETDVSLGLPALNMVGLPDMTLRESRERIRSALKNAGFDFPARRITINLSPANTKKYGNHFDLPMAIGIMSAMDVIPYSSLKEYAFLGELSLDGTVKSIEQCFALLLGLRRNGITKVFLPSGNIKEAAIIKGLLFFPIDKLSDVADHFSGFLEIKAIESSSFVTNFELPEDYSLDFSDVQGQERVKRALLVCAAGKHNICMIGPPGVGKSMLAKRIPSILPDMSYEEMLEVMKLHSIAQEGELSGESITRPFRAPHHSATKLSLLGGGNIIRPGELTLAHRGVLFLDELTEFPRKLLDSLRQPLEDGNIMIARSGFRIKMPCDFIFVAAMNPCPCGYYGHPTKECTCSAHLRRQYITKISGPLLERIDIHIDVDPPDYETLRMGRTSDYSNNKGASSKMMKDIVLKTTEIQKKRFIEDGISCNAELSGKLLKKYCILDSSSEKLLADAFERFSLSARIGTKILKLARTIADIEESENIKINHLSEAIGYRQRSKYD